MPWQVLGVSVRGLSHERSGLPCQDAFAYHVIPEAQLCIVAVADGAGSARYSDQGAKIATEAVVKILAQDYQKLLVPLNEKIWQQIAIETAQNALKAIESHAKQQGDTPLSDYACTLLTIVAAPDWVAGFQIGDGAIVIANHQKDPCLLLSGPSGEYVNETFFLTSVDAFARLSAVYLKEHIDKAAIMTDGISLLALKMPDQTPHSAFFRPFFELIDDQSAPLEDKKAQMSSFFTSERVRQRTDDDITLVLISASSPKRKTEPETSPVEEVPQPAPLSTQSETALPHGQPESQVSSTPVPPPSIPSSYPPKSKPCFLKRILEFLISLVKFLKPIRFLFKKSPGSIN